MKGSDFIYGIIASAVFYNDIVEGINQEPIYKQVGKLSEEDFLKYCIEASRINMSALIVDLDVTANEESVFRGIQQYKMLRPLGRVIVLAVGREPGNKVLSLLVNIAVYDVLTPSIPEPEDEDDEEIEIIVSPFIASVLDKPKNIADASRFQFFGPEFDKQGSDTSNNENDSKVSNFLKRKTHEKERIEKEQIEKEFIRKVYQTIPSKVVVVGSLYPGAGSTILSTNMARMIAKRGIDVAYIEHPLIKPYMFDYLQIHDGEYADVSREINQEGLIKSAKDGWVQDGVKWHVIDSRKSPLNSFTYENMLVLSHAMQSSVLIIDISNHWLDPEFQKYLYLADSILMCVEPNPIKYEKSYISVPNFNYPEKDIMELLSKTEQLNHYEIVLMKDGEGMDEKIVKDMLHKQPIAKVPYIPYQDVLDASNNIKLLYDFEHNGSIFEKSLKGVISEFIPSEFLELESERKGIIKRFFSKKNKSK